MTEQATTDAYDRPSRMAAFGLFGETVFQFNAQYRRAWLAPHGSGVKSFGRLHAGGQKVAFFVPILFEKSTRNFRWAALASRILDIAEPIGTPTQKTNKEKVDVLQSTLISMLPMVYPAGSTTKEPTPTWKTFTARLIRDDGCAEAVALLEGELWLLRRDVDHPQEVDQSTYAERLFIKDPGHGRFYALCRAIIIIYSSFPMSRFQNLEGLFYRFLQRTGHEADLRGDDILPGDTFNFSGEPDKLKLWLDVRKYTKSHAGWDARPKILNQVDECYDLHSKGRRAEDVEILGKYKQRPHDGYQSFFNESFLFNLLMGKPFSADVTGVAEDGAAQLSFGEELEKRSRVLIVPVYDFWLGGMGVGCVRAVFIVVFDDARTRRRWQRIHLRRLQANFERMSIEMAATAESKALAVPIEPPYDLVRHFLKILVHVQDWEEACVFRGDRGVYRFMREEGKGDDVRSHWRYTQEGCEKGNQNAGVEGEPGGFFMWWTSKDEPGRGMHDLWSADFLPDLTNEERATVSGISIRFRFPNACAVPGDPDSRAFLAESCLRQQLDLMRALIPKVRARRAALRSAVSAIMGRNMSHNIGSHVLARYASEITKTSPGDDQGRDVLVDFLGYLQRRMDFLAEVATSDRAFWSQPVSLKQQLVRFDFRRQCARYWGGADGKISDATLQACRTRLPVLSHITGKENLTANVDFQAVRESEGACATDDPLFDCPGGEVGIHALYIIVENVIRNSARHSGATGGEQIDIQVKAKCDDTGLVEVTIIDPRTRLHEDGTPCHRKGHECTDEECATSRESWAMQRCRIEEIGNDAISLFDAGRRVRLVSVPADINSILTDEAFLDEGGAPNPKFWGVREMQICAHYLRHRALSDLESAGGPSLRAAVHPDPSGHEATAGFCLKYVIRLEQAKLLAIIKKGKVEEDERGKPFPPGFTVVSVDTTAPDAAEQLSDVADQLSGYAFVATDDDEIYKWICSAGTSDERATPAGSDFPVRRLRLAKEGEDGLTVDDATDLFCRKDGSEPPAVSAALERLHETLACHDRDSGQRPRWKGRKIAAIAVARDYLKCEQSNGPVSIFESHDEDTGQMINPDWMAKQISDKALGMLWLDHAKEKLFAKIPGLNDDAWGADIPESLFGWISAEGVFQGSPQADLLSSLSSAPAGWELVAAALPRVAILDERVQAEADSNVRGLICKKIWRRMGVWVPERDDDEAKDINLNYPDLAKCREFLEAPLPGGSSQYPINHLIVHLTILEALSKALSDKPIDEVIADLVADTQAANAEIYIVTGRGVPSVARATASNQGRGVQAPRARGARFLPISALLEYLVTRPSKLGLMRVLWSAARPRALDGQTIVRGATHA